MSNKLIKSTNDFYQHLAFRESSNNPSCVSVRGYLGLYQMGEMALDDAGYYNSRDGTKKMIGLVSGVTRTMLTVKQIF